MGLLFLEALLAGLVFVGIVYWTMFSGRKKGEMQAPQEDEQATRDKRKDT